MKRPNKQKLLVKDSQALIAFVNMVLKNARFDLSGEEAIQFADLSVQIKDLSDKLQAHTQE